MEKLRKLPPGQMLMILVVVAVVLTIIGLMVLPGKKPLPHLGSSDRALAISADGSKLVMGMRNGVVRIFSLAQGRATPLVETRLPAPVLSVTFGPKEYVVVLMAPAAPDPDHPELQEPNATLQILSPDLRSRVQRRLQPNAHDVAWSEAAASLIVLSGGPDDLHGWLEVFPNQPIDVRASTSQLVELRTYTAPRRIAVSNDGSRVAVTFGSSKQSNLGIFDWRTGKTLTTHLVTGPPEGLAFSPGGETLAVASPAAEAVTFVLSKRVIPVQVPKSSSMSPPQVLVFNPEGTRVYTAGGLTLPEISYNPAQVARKAELPHRSSSIVLSLDGHTAYLSYDDSEDLGIFDLISGAGLAVTWREQ